MRSANTERNSDRAKLRPRRQVDLALTALTTVLFLGFLWIITAHPRALGPSTIIGVGFALIAYSVLATFFYQRWIERRENDGGRS